MRRRRKEDHISFTAPKIWIHIVNNPWESIGVPFNNAPPFARTSDSLQLADSERLVRTWDGVVVTAEGRTHSAIVLS